MNKLRRIVLTIVTLIAFLVIYHVLSSRWYGTDHLRCGYWDSKPQSPAVEINIAHTRFLENAISINQTNVHQLEHIMSASFIVDQYLGRLVMPSQNQNLVGLSRLTSDKAYAFMWDISSDRPCWMILASNDSAYSIYDITSNGLYISTRQTPRYGINFSIFEIHSGERIFHFIGEGNSLPHVLFEGHIGMFIPRPFQVPQIMMIYDDNRLIRDEFLAFTVNVVHDGSTYVLLKDQSLIIWDGIKQEVIFTIPHRFSNTFNLIISADEQTLGFTDHSAREVHLYSLIDGTHRIVPFPDESNPQLVAILHNGNLVLRDNALETVFDPISHEIIYQYDGKFWFDGSDDDFIVVSYRNNLYIIEANTGAILSEYQFDGVINEAKLSADRSYLVVTIKSGQIVTLMIMGILPD